MGHVSVFTSPPDKDGGVDAPQSANLLRPGQSTLRAQSNDRLWRGLQDLTNLLWCQFWQVEQVVHAPNPRFVPRRALLIPWRVQPLHILDSLNLTARIAAVR
jgi:hypothetical protein